MKVLIIGFGSIAQKHIASIYRIDKDAEIWALRTSPIADEFGGVKNLFDYSRIHQIDPDCFLVTNPTAAHYETIRKLISFKKPLFIEKPLFDHVSNEMKDLVKTVKDSQILTYVGCNLRFLDCLVEIRRIVRDIRVNEVNMYCGSYLPNWRNGIDWRKNYSANKEMGGGVHIDLIHELDYAYWIFGEPVETNQIFRNRSSLNISSFDYANYLWNYIGFSVSIILNYYRRDSKRQLEIVADDATYVVNLLENKIFKNEDLIFESKQNILDTYDSQMEYFFNMIKQDEKDSFNSINDSYKILKLCLKAD